jgi:RHS repeat-associated protein
MKFSEIANRLTGISTPLVGVSWQPTDLEVSAARRVIAFLEDRRVLYAPEEMEVASHCVDSVLEIISALGLRTLAVENRVGSRCTGKERDSESGLDNFGARYDASSMGRFMSADPVFISADRLTDPQSLNLYAYVRNNPLSLVDPTGLDFYLACQTSDHSGCGQVTNGEGGGKSWVQGQTVNGQFQATDVDMND